MTASERIASRVVFPSKHIQIRIGKKASEDAFAEAKDLLAAVDGGLLSDELEKTMSRILGLISGSLKDEDLQRIADEVGVRLYSATLLAYAFAKTLQERTGADPLEVMRHFDPESLPPFDQR